MPAAVPIITAATGIYGAVSGSRAASRAQRQQQNATDQQAAIAREQLQFGREQYADWRNMFMPVLGDLRDMAFEDVRPDYAGIAADVGQAFDASQGINRRQMERFGIAPTDGAAQNSEMQYGLGRALAQVGGANQARMAARDTRFNRMAALGSLSQGQQASAINSLQGGWQGLSNVFGNQAAMYGQQQNQYAQAAAAGAQMAGFGLNQWLGQQAPSQQAGLPRVNVIPGWGG